MIASSPKSENKLKPSKGLASMRCLNVKSLLFNFIVSTNAHSEKIIGFLFFLLIFNDKASPNNKFLFKI